MLNVIYWNPYSTMTQFTSSTVKCIRIIIRKQECTKGCLEVINRLPWLTLLVCLKFKFPFDCFGPVVFMTEYGGSHSVQISAF